MKRNQLSQQVLETVGRVSSTIASVAHLNEFFMTNGGCELPFNISSSKENIAKIVTELFTKWYELNDSHSDSSLYISEFARVIEVALQRLAREIESRFVHQKRIAKEIRETFGTDKTELPKPDSIYGDALLSVTIKHRENEHRLTEVKALFNELLEMAKKLVDEKALPSLMLLAEPGDEFRYRAYYLLKTKKTSYLRELKEHMVWICG